MRYASATERAHLSSSPRLDRVAFLGNYLPRLCGIATFTHDLCEAISEAAPNADCFVAAINDLREPQRSAVILREIQGLSYREIAEALEMTEATLRVTLHRGRRKLRTTLEEVYHDATAK